MLKGLRFQKRITIIPGLLRINFSKSGVSFSAGPEGADINFGKDGVTANSGIPGTGLSYRRKLGQGGKFGWLAILGVLAGLWAQKFDQLAAVQNFVIMPMTFLSGVFYSVHSLPAFWQAVSHLNPFFYMIDGFRRGFFGVSDASPWLSLAVVGTRFLLVAAVALRLLHTGYKIRS